MENPFKDPRIRACLIVAAFLIGGSYLAFKQHVLFSNRRFGEPATAMIADIFGGIYAIAAAAALGYAWRLYRLNAAARKGGADRQGLFTNRRRRR